MTKKVALLDVCLPDYFSGYHLPVLHVALYGRMTKAELSQAIKDEFNAVWDYINPNDDKETEALYQEFCSELESDGDAIFFKGDPDYNEDEYDDCYEPAWAYFSIIEPVWSNGIMFLNK